MKEPCPYTKWILILVLTLVTAAAKAQEVRTNPMTTFKHHALTEEIADKPWKLLLEDEENDGSIPDGPDGKQLYFHYDGDEDRLWFRIESYESLGTFPAVSISIDTDANQQTGIEWYGANKSFTFEKMISLGPVRETDGGLYGYNGITDQEGVRARNWINHRKGVVSYYSNPDNTVIVLSVKRGDIDDTMKKINLIGSVGSRARWNDDIGDENYATVQLR